MSRNDEAVAGLRLAANWLEMHDLPPVEVSVGFGRLPRDEALRVAKEMDGLKDLREIPAPLSSLVAADVNDAVTVQMTAERGGSAPSRWVVRNCLACGTWGCDECEGRGYTITEPTPVTTADFLTREAGIREVPGSEYSRSGDATWADFNGEAA